MASYVNDLRLKEIGTGESSGTWGTETNTNLELIGDALGFGTEAITTNADTHTTTVADGSADAGRAMYIKYTGTLDSACTITIGPNTINRMHFIENATTGSQNIIISQGTGSNVTIPAGDVKAVYLDGAGSGAAVADAFTDLNLAGTTTVDALNVSGALTGSSTIQGTTITATTAFVPDASDGAALGTSSLEFSDLFLADAAVINLGDDQDTTLTHVADTGILLNSTRQLQFGDSGTYIHQSADGVLDLVSDTELELNATTIDMNGNLDLSGTINGISILADATNFTDSILISQNASTGTLDAATNNTGLGDTVFAALTSGDNNVGVGADSLKALTTGSGNVAVGFAALETNTTSDNNTAVGFTALLSNTTGTENVAVGKGAGDAITTGGYNTAVGTDALGANTTATFNTAIGRNALLSNTTGASNVAVGGQALDANTTASNNTAVGTSSLGANTTGASNVAVGTDCLQQNTTASNNTAVGKDALRAVTGNDNIGIGHDAGDNITSGSNNVVIGGFDVDTATGDDQIIVGSGDGGVTWLKGDSNGIKALKIKVKAVTGTETLTDAQSGSYVYVTGSGVPTLPATAESGQQYTIINNTGGNLTPGLGTSNAIATGWTAHAAMSDETARTYICVAANKWIYIG